MVKLKNIITDPEFWFVLVFNFLIAIGYNNGIISQDTVIWIYFIQSVFIGLSNTIRMACLKTFTSDNFRINNEEVNPTSNTKWSSAIFFTIHYGIFHLVYFIMLAVMSVGNGSKLDFRLVLINMMIIAGNTLISTWSNVLKDREEPPSIGSMFFTPYLRVFPMHLFLMAGMTLEQKFNVQIPILGAINIFYMFLGLKIVSDLAMHIVVQKSWRGKRIKPVGGYI